MPQWWLAFILPLTAAAVLPSDTDGCHPDKMTVYRMVLHTYWTREKFPKHYPDWRPPAQWSKIYGKFSLSYCVTLPGEKNRRNGRFWGDFSALKSSISSMFADFQTTLVKHINIVPSAPSRPSPLLPSALKYASSDDFILLLLHCIQNFNTYWLTVTDRCMSF